MVALAALLVLASTLAAPALAHEHSSRTDSALPSRWYHDDDHFAHSLFRRNSKRADPSPSVGSPSWSAKYPASTPDPSSLPQSWVDALNAAVSAGKIPDIPPSTSTGGNSPVYPAGTNEKRNDPSICAATDRICRIPEDIWDAPDGVIGIGFDDGPSDGSAELYAFLQQQNQKATHYMIGVNVLNNWQEFLVASEKLGDDIAVHTYTHPYMTTQTNQELLAQFGWTIQIIYDSTNGKLPRFWRPPYGDIDQRVSAIAREVFGMSAILWNQDTEDWSMASGGTTPEKIQASMQQWLSGPKSPGLIILEHELTNDTVAAFKTAWPLVAQNNWKPVSQAEMNASMPVYQDGQEDDAVFNSFIKTDATTSAAPGSTSSSTASSAANKAPSSTTGSSASASGTAASRQGAVSGASAFARPSLAVFGLLVASALMLV
ncbi:glycoside hydrolase/deacetylase [Phellopilus nigrolimitatus]|nr:glycoside hydrolase/deacetylase [Phellopilus nigrolimitatus]